MYANDERRSERQGAFHERCMMALVAVDEADYIPQRRLSFDKRCYKGSARRDLPS